MGYGYSVHVKAKEVMQQRRAKALREAEYRLQEIYNKIPRIEEIDRKLSSLGSAAARAVVKGGDVKQHIEELKVQSLGLQEERKMLLAKHGYSFDYDEPKFVCNICSDTGTIEKNGISIQCDCMKKLMFEVACDDINRIAPLKLSTFDKFDYTLQPDEVISGINLRENIKRIYLFCRKYASTFGEESKNLLMKGGPGLGKTHLSLAIANEVLHKGFGVIYASAPSLISKLEKEHFSYRYDDLSETEDAVTNCDLLIIDDLGSEFSNQFSTKTLYNILNNRILLGKPIIISTNLSFENIESAYSTRFLSRIAGNCGTLNFVGKDVRNLVRR